MKKLMLVIISLVLTISLFTGCSRKAVKDNVSNDGQTYHWRFAHEENNGSIQDVYVKEFVRRLEERSDGKIKIDIYPVGQIGDATQQCELLQNGGLEFAIISPGNTGTIVPENQLFSLHFLFSEDMEKNKEIFKNSEALNTMLNKKYLDKKIKVLSYWTEGTMEWTTNKPVNTPDKWKGLKMRTMPSPMIVASYEAYGSNPTPMPYMEVYSGLQLNMIEGQENPLSATEEMKFYEVQKYLTLGGSSLYATTTATNPEFFDSLPVDIQQMILDTVEETREFAFKAQADLNNGALEKIQDASDIEVVYLTKEERLMFKEASKSAYDAYKKMTGADGAAILDKLIEEIEAIEAR